MRKSNLLFVLGIMGYFGWALLILFLFSAIYYAKIPEAPSGTLIEGLFSYWYLYPFLLLTPFTYFIFKRKGVNRITDEFIKIGEEKSLFLFLIKILIEFLKC